MRIITYNTLRDENDMCQLVKENSTNLPSLDNISTPKKVSEMLCKLFHADRLTEEYVWLIAVTAKQKVIGIFELSHGNIDSSIMSPREIFMKLCACNACGFILAHNHVSGIPDPSEQDIQVAKKIEQAAKLMAFKFFDNIIVGEAGMFYSFYSEDLL